MKTTFQQWVIVPLLCWANYACTQTTSDTLVANISDRARIYFIGQSKEDFKEIEKYDLNIVFKTLQQQAQNKKVKLSQAEADALRNDAFLIQKSKVSFWKKTYFNFYVGAASGSSTQYLVNNEKFTQDPTTGLKTNIHVLDYATTYFPSQLNLGFGLFKEKKILQTPEKELVLRYGLGYQRLKIKPSYEHSGYSIFVDNQLKTSNTTTLLNTIREGYKGRSEFIKYNTMHYANVELIPTFRKLSAEGKTKWELGIGLRTGVGGQAGILRRLVSFGQIQNGSQKMLPLDLLTTPKSDIWINFIPVDYALLANFGYKYLKFFAEYHPYVFNINHHLLENNGQWSNGTKQSGLWSVGLRFGK